MRELFRLAVFWVFQVVNLICSLGLFLAPKAFHESMFENPPAVYAVLGFSETAQDMLHNVLRSQGAALLAVSLFLFALGRRERRSYLLIALVCGLSLIAHFFTLHQHLDSEIVMRAMNDFSPLYGLGGLNGLLTLGGVWAWRGRE